MASAPATLITGFMSVSPDVRAVKRLATLDHDTFKAVNPCCPAAMDYVFGRRYAVPRAINGETPMFKFISTGALIAILCAGAALWPALSAAEIPDFSSNNVAWDGGGENEFIPPKSGPGPVTSDPAHPYISNFRAARTGERANWRIADLTNPILKPWVVEALRQQNADAFAGKARFTRVARRWAPGD